MDLVLAQAASPELPASVVVTIILFVVGLIVSLIAYINRLHSRDSEKLAASVASSFERVGLRIDALAEKLTDQSGRLWKTVGSLEAKVQVLEERDKQREKELSQLRDEFERRMGGMHGKVNELSTVTLQLQAAARKGDRP